MRNCFIAVITFIFMSGCGEKDPAQKFLGRYNMVGQTNKGVVIGEDKTGFLFYPDGQRNFTWELNSDGEFLTCRGRSKFTLSFDDSFLMGKFGAAYGKITAIRYERAK